MKLAGLRGSFFREAQLNIGPQGLKDYSYYSLKTKRSIRISKGSLSGYYDIGPQIDIPRLFLAFRV